MLIVKENQEYSKSQFQSNNILENQCIHGSRYDLTAEFRLI